MTPSLSASEPSAGTCRKVAAVTVQRTASHEGAQLAAAAVCARGRGSDARSHWTKSSSVVPLAVGAEPAAALGLGRGAALLGEADGRVALAREGRLGSPLGGRGPALGSRDQQQGASFGHAPPGRSHGSDDTPDRFAGRGCAHPGVRGQLSLPPGVWAGGRGSDARSHWTILPSRRRNSVRAFSPTPVTHSPSPGRSVRRKTAST